LRSGVAEVARLPRPRLRKSGDFRYTHLRLRKSGDFRYTHLQSALVGGRS